MSGFASPNYTQVPNDYFDLVMEMTEAETKVLTALVRATFGFHRDEIKLSVRALAKATKMSTSSVWIGAGKLEERGLIEKSVSEFDTVTTWRVVISDTGLYRQIIKSVSDGTAKVGLKKERKSFHSRKEKRTPADKLRAFLQEAGL